MCIHITIRDIAKTFAGTAGQVDALENVNLEVRRGEFLCLVGPSGCGKSTLLFLVSGLVPPTRGEIRIDGQLVKGPGPNRTVVFQGDAVFPWMTVAQNIGYGLRFMRLPKPDRKRIVEHLLELVGLEAFRNAYPKELSGGMKKRVDLARAYATDPEVLLMDEPFGALDAITKEKMQVDLMRLTTAEEGRSKTVLFVTHDLEEALFLADRIAVMTARPGTIQTVVEVPFPRPREASIRLLTEFQEIRGHLRALLETREEGIAK